MNIIDEDWETDLASALNHVTQKQGTATGEHALTTLDIDATFAQEIIELSKELLCISSDQHLYFSGQDRRLSLDNLVNIAILNKHGSRNDR